MNTEQIISRIDSEILKLQQVKALLLDVSVPLRIGPGRPKKSVAVDASITRTNNRKPLSAEGKACIAATQKARWAKIRKTGKKTA